MVKRIPVLDYIKVQGRFKTATEEDIEALQKSVDLGIEKLKKEAEGIC
jgi:hypothetical protein